MAITATMTPEQVRRRTLYSGTIGAIVEWYEYTVYATAAALVFGPLFFPAMEPGISQIAALATFGVGFVARPVGAFVVSGQDVRWAPVVDPTRLLTLASLVTVVYLRQICSQNVLSDLLGINANSIGQAIAETRQLLTEHHRTITPTTPTTRPLPPL